MQLHGLFYILNSCTNNLQHYIFPSFGFIYIIFLKGIANADDIDMKKCPGDKKVEAREGDTRQKVKYAKDIEKFERKLRQLYPDKNPTYVA